MHSTESYLAHYKYKLWNSSLAEAADFLLTRINNNPDDDETKHNDYCFSSQAVEDRLDNNVKSRCELVYGRIFI